MKSSPTYNLQFRRKRKQKTDYNKRLKILKSNEKRLSVSFSNKIVRAQIIDYKVTGDVSLVFVTSSHLKKFGWNHSLKNTPAFYLTGLLAGIYSKQKNINKVVFDTGVKNYKPKTKIYAILKGIIDAGIFVAHDPKAFPSKERMQGTNLGKSKNMENDFLNVKQKILSIK